MKKPDFFIVGAPKCGTTSLCKYLEQHSNIFIPPVKEFYYFCTDSTGKKRANTLEEYLSFFEDGQGKLCGEGSVWHLFTKKAALEIYKFNPEAKIIIMLREPVSVMYSLHSMHLANGSNEEILDFKLALEAEEDRKQGKRIPKKCFRLEELLYREVVKFTEQVKRYFDTFGREQVHIIIFDDFKSNPDQVYRETLEFLGVEPDFVPDLTSRNPNRRVRNATLQQLIIKPPTKLLEIGKYFVPFPRSVRRNLLQKLKQTVRRFNTQKAPRPPLDPELRRSLQQEFAPEIEKLSDLLGRDLTYWSKDYPSG